eukprot:m.400314 g.400314  ORF g.400314 m.400314 type:complete len:132 (-) comp20114_c4_seq2:2675-3070(-)
MLAFMLGEGCIPEPGLAAAAARSGSLDALRLLVTTHGCEVDEETMASAAQAGSVHVSLECLQYLLEQKCPWDTRATFHAARLGHLPVLKFLHENGCPFDEDCINASMNGDQAVLQYLTQIGCPRPHYMNDQ